MFIELDDNNYNSINISSVKEVEKTEDNTTIYQVIITFKNGQQMVKSYDNKSDADAELEEILSAGPSGGGGDLSNYYTKSETEQLDTQTLNSAKGYTDEKVVNTVPTVTAMPNASSTYNGKVYQYIGTTDQNYTNGYFYICNNSGGSYAWHQLNVQPSSSGGQVYQHISTSSTNDFGKNSENAIDFTTLQKGTHIFKNVSTYYKLYYKYKKTSSSSYTSTSFTYDISYSNSPQYSSYFIIEIFEDMSGGIYELNLDNGYNVALISVYVNNDYSELVYSMVVSNKKTGTIDYGTRSNLASSSQLRNVYLTANSASQESYQNTQSISALDTRVQALEKGGGGSGGSQTEYISDAAGTPYPPSTPWSETGYNTFSWSKNVAEFKDGTDEDLYLTLLPGSTYDKISVNFNYNYMSAQLDTSDFTIPNVVIKIYNSDSGDELCTLDVGNVELKYNSGSNKWNFDKYDISYQYIMSGIKVACKMFYGESSGSGVKVIKYSDLKIPQGSESALFDYIANYNIDLNIPAFLLFDIPSGMPSISVQVNGSSVMITNGETYTLIKTETEMGSITYQYTIMQSINSSSEIRQFVIEYNDGMMHPTVTGGYTQFTQYGGH